MSGPSTGTSVLLVDDHELIRFGVLASLEAAMPDLDFTQVGTVSDAIDALNDAEFAFAVIDVRLPDGTGVDIAAHIAEAGMATRCLMLTSDPNPAALIAAFNTGVVDAFELKSGRPADLVEAMSAVRRGMATLTMRDVNEARAQVHQGLDRSALSERENLIVDAVGEGISDKEIAERLMIAAQTVRNSLTQIYKKLGITPTRGRLQALVNEERYGTS